MKEDRHENKDPINDKHGNNNFSPKVHNNKRFFLLLSCYASRLMRWVLIFLLFDRAHDLEKRYKPDEMNQEAVKLAKPERRTQSGLMDSGSEESDHKRKHKRSKRKDVTSDDDTSHDSRTEDRKEAKRRRKEEKKLRKEEKYKRREERRRKKESRREEKLKLKADKNVSPSSDFDKSHDSQDESTLSDQKKLEIELREKALESLRAKKGAGR